MARRIATHGYYVMLPNLYYRQTPAFELDFSSKESAAEMSVLMRQVGNKMVARDAGALFAHADADPAAHADRAGCVGYCMSGPFAIWLAAEYPRRVRAAASFYGVRLHVDAADSPHLRLGEITGELYVAAAEHDDYVPLDMVDRFEAAMVESGTIGRVERYWGTHHGFAFDDRPAYDPVADERHWTALLDLLERRLHSTTTDQTSPGECPIDVVVPVHPNIVLTGFMGTGKTTVGRLLAERLGMTFVDTDDLIEQRYGPIPGIFERSGEPGFRAAEAEVAADIAGSAGMVISTGGRLMLEPDNAARLGPSSRVFCLTAAAGEILRRVIDEDRERPLLAGSDPDRRIAKLLDERADGYAAFEQVPTDGHDPSEIVDDIVARLDDER